MAAFQDTFIFCVLGNVEISYDALGVEEVCSNRQSAVIWRRGLVKSSYTVTFIVAEKA